MVLVNLQNLMICTDQSSDTFSVLEEHSKGSGKILFNVCCQILTEYFYSLDVFRWQLMVSSQADEETWAVFSLACCVVGCSSLVMETLLRHQLRLRLLFVRQLKWDKMNPTQCAHKSVGIFVQTKSPKWWH